MKRKAIWSSVNEKVYSALLKEAHESESIKLSEHVRNILTERYKNAKKTE